MKAITIHQPWAALIMRGEKRVENRNWGTQFRGQIAIHASKPPADVCPAWDSQWEKYDPLVFGAVIGVVEILNCLHISEVQRAWVQRLYPWLRTHQHVQGPWCWVIGNVQRLKPIHCRGQQGLWNLPDLVEVQLHDAGWCPF